MSVNGRGRQAALVLAAVGLVAALVPVSPPAVASPAAGGPRPLEGAVELAGDPSSFATASVDDPLRSLQWYLDRIRVDDAWTLTRGVPEVTVAVIDTGVDPEHDDLARALWRDDAGWHGYDHVRQTFDTYAGPVADWHGTAIAGIVAARGDDGSGMVGVAPEVRVMVHRIYGSASSTEPPGPASYELATQAIRDAAAAGADVILLAWGGTRPNAALAAAIEEAGVPVVAAAGNDGQDLSGSPTLRRYPAVYRFPNLVTVAASDQANDILANDRLASNYGVRHVDLAAPGADVVAPVPGDDHALFEGTSFAAPQVAGALALGRSIAPGLSTNELVAALVTTVRRQSVLQDKVISGGVLDVHAFLRAVDRPVCHAEIPPQPFADVDRSAVHVVNVDCVAWYRVTLGTGPDEFSPRRTVTRGEMATFVARALQAAGWEPDPGPEDGTDDPDDPDGTTGGGTGQDSEDGHDAVPFTDVAGTTHEEAIVELARAGVVGGVGDGTFAPGRPVTRAQMATFVVGAVELLLGRTVDAERAWFDDVAGNVHERSILVARELGITLGASGPRLFDPHLDMTREQMASFLARMLDAMGRQGVTVEPRS